MEVFSSGVLKVLPQYPQRVLTLDNGGIQQGYCIQQYVNSNTQSLHSTIRSGNLATLYPYEVEN